MNRSSHRKAALPQRRLDAAASLAATRLCRSREEALLSILQSARKASRELEQTLRIAGVEGSARLPDQVLSAAPGSTSGRSGSKQGACTVQTFSLINGQVTGNRKAVKEITVYDPTQCPPHASIVMPVSTNFLTPEQEPIKHIPIVTEKDMPDYLEKLPPSVQDAIDMSDINSIAEEKAQFFHDFGVEIFKAAGISYLALTAFLLGELEPKQQETDIDLSSHLIPRPGSKNLFPHKFSMKSKRFAQLQRQLPDIQKEVPEEAIRRTCIALKSAIGGSTWAWLGISSDCTSNLPTALEFLKSPRSRRNGVRNHAEIPEAMTYGKLNCLICMMHDCPTHGDYVGDDRTMIVRGDGKNQLTVAQVRQLLTVADEADIPRPRGKVNLDQCSSECYLRPSARPSTDPSSWSDLDLSVIARSNHACDQAYYSEACHLAYSMDQSCIDVHRALTIVQRAVSGQFSTLMSSPPSGSLDSSPPHRISSAARRRHPISHSSDIDDPTDPGTHAMLISCVHDGPCTVDNPACNCIDRENPLKSECEKFCQCSSRCQIRVRGCDCAAESKACETQKCVCWLNHRECDPDLCSSCGVRELVSTQRAKDRGRNKSKLCRNAGITVGKSKRTLLGTSLTPNAGYGLFIGEAVTTGHYIGEYVGELLDHAESERRGELYDPRGCSYLFGLNTHQTIDATVYGNKLRYINHGIGDVQNCFSRIRLVNGVHRIGFYAAQNLREGEELYFDYGYKIKDLGFEAALPEGVTQAWTGKEERTMEERTKDRDSSDSSWLGG